MMVSRDSFAETAPDMFVINNGKGLPDKVSGYNTPRKAIA